jgi:SET domain
MKPGCVRVGVSRLHGFGVFAACTIPPSTLLGEYVGKVMRVRPIDCTYVMCVTVDSNEHLWVDASDPAESNWTRYLNDPGDGAQASCEFRQHDLSVEVWSCRRIAPGEELTVKYMTWNSPVGQAG